MLLLQFNSFPYNTETILKMFCVMEQHIEKRRQVLCLVWAQQYQRKSQYVILGLLKGQLISKCPFGIIVWTKIPTKLFLDFCPEIFWTLLGASWKLFGASCRLPCLWYYILSPQEAQKASRKPPGSNKKIQGRNPEIISLVFLSKQ